MDAIAKGLLKLAGGIAGQHVKNELAKSSIRAGGGKIDFFSNCAAKRSDGTLWHDGTIAISGGRLILKAKTKAFGYLGKGVRIDEDLDALRIVRKTIKAGLFKRDGFSIQHGAIEYLVVGAKPEQLLRCVSNS